MLDVNEHTGTVPYKYSLLKQALPQFRQTVHLYSNFPCPTITAIHIQNLIKVSILYFHQFVTLSLPLARARYIIPASFTYPILSYPVLPVCKQNMGTRKPT